MMVWFFIAGGIVGLTIAGIAFVWWLTHLELWR